jgi:putative SOS response-associated peptidase YedK
MSPIHDRMPVIVDRGNFDLWLDPKMEDAEKLQPLLVAHTEYGFEAFPVSRLVNSPVNDLAGCIEPLIQE